jgi:prophage maintenance system killer protein
MKEKVRKTTKRSPALQVREGSAINGPRRGEIVLYNAPDGTVSLDVRLEGETIWLTQAQMTQLFDRDQSVIARHLSNVFAEGELTVSESNMQKMHIAGADRPVVFYNLDVIISVGYRVKSRSGTQFRIWATRILRDHLLKGYTINERRLKELKQAVRLVADVAGRREMTGDEAGALLKVVSEYSFALDLLDDYDHQRVMAAELPRVEAAPVTPSEARRAVKTLRVQYGASDLFGREKDDSLSSALAAIMQTAGGQEVYPSVEEKAAHLLYFLVKNHPFVDGNKRIAAALFLWFLQKNNALIRSDGARIIEDGLLVAMTLLIAESRPREKEVLTNVLTHLLIGKEQKTRNK